MPMKIESLKEFLVLSETRSYWKAADQLFISQSTLSRHIKELEHDLGAPLFVRSTRNMELTQFGMLLLPYAKKMLQLTEELNESFVHWIELSKNTLNIGTTFDLREDEIAEHLAGFQLDYPNVCINLVKYELDNLYKMIENEMCDFAFVREQNKTHTDGLNRVLVSKEALTVYMKGNHPLAKHKSISLDQLHGEPLMMLNEESLTYQVGTEACRKCGFEPDILFKGKRMQTLQYLKNGMGIALLFGGLPPALKRSGIVSMKLEPPIYSYINLLYASNSINPVKLSFLDHLLTSDFTKAKAD